MGELASYKYSETGPNFLFPSLAKLLSPAAAVNRFIKDISPSSTHGVYGPYRVPSLPRDAVGQSIRVGAVTDAFMGNLFPHFIAQGKGGHQGVGRVLVQQATDFQRPFRQVHGWLAIGAPRHAELLQDPCSSESRADPRSRCRSSVSRRRRVPL
jgi:hypothetical protein